MCFEYLMNLYNASMLNVIYVILFSHRLLFCFPLFAIRTEKREELKKNETRGPDEKEWIKCIQKNPMKFSHLDGVFHSSHNSTYRPVSTVSEPTKTLVTHYKLTALLHMPFRNTQYHTRHAQIPYIKQHIKFDVIPFHLAE